LHKDLPPARETRQKRDALADAAAALYKELPWFASFREGDECMRIAPMALGVILVASSARAASFTELVDFGDSLSDVGNIYSLTSSLSPLIPIVPGAPGYTNGHFSNGPIWVEQFAGLLGVPVPTFSREGGTDYAYGLAHSGSGNTNLLIPNIQTQINDWTGNHASTGTQLFTVMGGATDLLDAIDSSDSAADKALAATTAAGNIAAGVQALYDDGARNILVANLPDLGQVPRYLNTANQTQATTLSATFDTALAADLAAVAASPGLHLYGLDLHSLFEQAISDPAAFGLSNVTDPAYTGDSDYVGNGTAVADPSGYLFWDSLHPTTVGHDLMAQYAYNVVPEPASLWLLALGGIAVCRRRRDVG
jgi:outer membrane lipase/esterase